VASIDFGGTVKYSCKSGKLYKSASIFQTFAVLRRIVPRWHFHTNLSIQITKGGENAHIVK